MTHHNKNEAQARLKINRMLQASGWKLNGDSDDNVRVEQRCRDVNGIADYVLMDSRKFPLCVLEAKKPSIHPLSAKEQARKYAESKNIRFVILSNSEVTYFWDLQTDNPHRIFDMPSQFQLEKQSNRTLDKAAFSEIELSAEYIALTQDRWILENPSYRNLAIVSVHTTDI